MSEVDGKESEPEEKRYQDHSASLWEGVGGAQVSERGEEELHGLCGEGPEGVTAGQIGLKALDIVVFKPRGKAAIRAVTMMTMSPPKAA